MSGYVAGYNMAGYLPDVDPEAFETEAEAREYLASELDRWTDQEFTVDDGYSDSVAIEYQNAAKELRDGSTYVLLTPNHGADYSFWVEPSEGE